MYIAVVKKKQTIERVPSQDVTCELCNAVVKARGLKTHLRNAHRSTLVETKDVQSTSVQSTANGETIVLEELSVKRLYRHYESPTDGLPDDVEYVGGWPLGKWKWHHHRGTDNKYFTDKQSAIEHSKKMKKK